MTLFGLTPDTGRSSPVRASGKLHAVQNDLNDDRAGRLTEQSFNAKVNLLFDDGPAFFFAQLIGDSDFQSVVTGSKLTQGQSATREYSLWGSTFSEWVHWPRLAGVYCSTALHHSRPHLQLRLGLMPFRGSIIYDEFVFNLATALESSLGQGSAATRRFHGLSLLV